MGCTCGCGAGISPALEIVRCPRCGYENEVWSDDEQPACIICKGFLIQGVSKSDQCHV